VNTQDAIKALMAAGQEGDVQQLLTKKSDDAAMGYRRIREDKMTSDAGQRWQLANAYTRARTDVDKQLNDMASKVTRTDRDDAERVFGVKGLPGDEASLVISRRDASDRVANAEDPKELRELLRRATRSGDEVLAHAVAERAVEEQDVTTMNQFLADRPALDAAGERLWNMQRASRDSMMLTMGLLDLMPAELQGMAHDDIEVLAQTQPAAEPKPALATGFGAFHVMNPPFGDD